MSLIRSLIFLPLIFPVGFYYSQPELWGCEAKRSGMVLSFVLVCIFALASVLWKRNKAIALFLLVAVYSSCYPKFTGLNYNLICILLGCGWYLFWLGKKEMFMDLVCILGVIHTSLVISQYFGYDPIFNLTGNGFEQRVVGFFININFASAFIAVCFPAFLRKKWFWFIPALIFGLIVTRSTGPVLALVMAGVAWVLFSKFNEIVKTAMVFVLLISVIGYSFVDSPGYGRWEDWKVFSRLEYSESGKLQIGDGLPIEGLGLGAFMNSGIKFKGFWYTHAHNEYLEGLMEIGWMFIPVCLLFFYNIFKRFKFDLIAGMGVVTAVLIASVSYPMHIAPIAAVSLGWSSTLDNSRGVK